jgi:diguanylate cyclase (GGDEF)-like protein
MACCGALLLGARRLPWWAVKLIAIQGGSIATSISVAFIHPMGVAPLYYVWPAMTAGYFGTRRDAVAQVLVTAGGFAGALAIEGHQIGAGGMVSGTVVVLAVVTAWVVYVAEMNTNLVDRLAEVASTDALTGLLNRHALTGAAERELARARAAGLPISVVLFDLDHFKRLNDNFGHGAGDEALRGFATILDEHASVADLVARWGGEEFLVVLFDRDAAAAERWASAVAERLARESVGLTTSAGVASAGPDDELETLLLAADRALYAAKAAGRNHVRLAAAA